MERIKIILNWCAYHLGGLRGECLFETGDPIENAALEGIFGQ